MLSAQITLLTVLVHVLVERKKNALRVCRDPPCRAVLWDAV